MLIMKTLVTFILLTVWMSVLSGQKPVDIKLKSSVSKDQASCYDIQLRSPAGHDIKLAGQNYRIFYNGDQTQFLEDRITNNLDRETYGKLDVTNTVTGDIGFVSISLDSRIMTDKVLKLQRSGQWVNTLNVCFQHEANSLKELTWAHANKTGQFATAEVAMSEWIDAENQQILIPNEIIDHNKDGDDFISGDIKVSVFPNPVAEVINVQFEGENEASDVLIKDIIGREVVNAKINNADYLSYDLASWPEGTYMLMILNKDGQKLAAEHIVKITP